jgi:capsular exopolysaccharide synthesis family protein
MIPQRTSSANYLHDPSITIDAPARPEVSFVDIVMRRKGLIALCAFGFGLLAYLITIPQTRTYRAHTSLEFTGLNENVLNTRDVDPAASGESGSQSYINTQGRVLESTPLLERAINKVKATDKATGDARRLQAIRTLSVPRLSRGLTVRPGEMTKLIDIYVEWSDPAVAAELAGAVADEYMQMNTEVRTHSSQRTSDWLSQQVQEARQRLEKSETALQDYARRANLIYTGDGDSAAEARLREVQDEYSKAQADRMAKQAVYEALMNNQPEAITASLKDTALEDYQMKLSDLNRQLADLSTTYQPGYPKVQRIQSQIDQLKKDYARQREAALSRLRTDYRSSEKREEMLSRAYQSQQGVVTHQASTAVDYNILKREAETNRAVYEAMMQKVKSFGIASAMQLSNVRVVDPAEPPEFPSKPNVPLITAFGIMGGLFFGLVWVGMRDKGEVNIEYPGQVNHILQADELGVVPAARLDPYLKRKRGVPRLGPVTSPAVETATWFFKSSVVAESVRSIRTSLLSPREGETVRTILLTSLNPGHGKTSLVSNLGIAFSELGRKVLLVDADIRNPRLHSVFGLNNENGLANILEAGDRAEFEPAVQQTDVRLLSLLSSGPCNHTHPSSSLLHSPAMATLLERARRTYDYILIDTPPLTLADARVLGPLTDGVVLVLRAGDVRMDSVVAAEQLLERDGSRILGTILNDWDPRSNGYGIYPERYHNSVQLRTTVTE